MTFRSRRRIQRPVAAAAYGSGLVNAAKLAFARTRLRGAALGYFAFAFENGGAHRNRTDQAICLQGKSGFLARTPETEVAYGNHSFDSHSLAASIDNFTVGTAGWTRTTFSPLKRRDSCPLSYDGNGPGAASWSRTKQVFWTRGLQSRRGPSPSNAANWYPVQIERLRHSVCRTDALHV